ncbi:MAG: cellobiose phosphorylase, partial [Bacteroidota bacterium]
MKKSPQPQKWSFLNQDGNFTLDDPHLINYLYFPLANEDGILASITPTLGGDLKLNQHTFFLTPVSAEDLHNSRSTRNFWIYNEAFGPWSATGNSARQKSEHFGEEKEQVRLEAGFLWHRLIRENESLGITSEITSFVPETDQVELMQVKITNISKQTLRITPTAAIPIYGRSADNLRDHRHVTSLLNRIELTQYGVEVQPTFFFDERGHKLNKIVYAVLGAEAGGEPPIGFFPVVEEFIGEGGALDWPEAVVKNRIDFQAEGVNSGGYEALGGLRFRDAILEPNASQSYIIILAVVEGPNHTGALVKKYANRAAFDSSLSQNQNFWCNKL